MLPAARYTVGGNLIWNFASPDRQETRQGIGTYNSDPPLLSLVCLYSGLWRILPTCTGGAAPKRHYGFLLFSPRWDILPFLLLTYPGKDAFSLPPPADARGGV